MRTNSSAVQHITMSTTTWRRLCHGAASTSAPPTKLRPSASKRLVAPCRDR